MSSEFCVRLAEYWVYGALGGLAYELLSHGGLSIGEWDKRMRVLRLGFVGSMVIGILTAVAVDGDPVTALVAALGGPTVLEGLVRQVPRVLGALRAPRNTE